MGAEHAGGSFDLYSLFFAKANLSCHAFGIQFCIGEPWIKKLQAGILENFVFDLFQDCEDVLLLSEFDSQQGADALGQSQISVGIKQRQNHRCSSSWSAWASCSGVSSTCWM